MLRFVAQKAKRFDAMAPIDRAAVAESPTPANYRELFVDLYLAKDFAAAAATLSEMMEKFPAERNSQNLINLSRAQFFAGRHDAAIATARAENGADAGLLSWLAVVLSQTGKDDEAIAVYEDILKRFPGDVETVKRAHQGLSTCWTNKGDNAKGEAELEIVFQKFPEDAGVNNDLGYLYAEQGKNLEKAEAMIRKAVEEEPENGSYLDSLGWVLFKRGKVKEALEPLEKAAKGENLDFTICEHLGDVLFRLREYARAKDFWTRAEGFATKSPAGGKRLPEIRKKLADLDKLGPVPKPAERRPVTGDRGGPAPSSRPIPDDLTDPRDRIHGRPFPLRQHRPPQRAWSTPSAASSSASSAARSTSPPRTATRTRTRTSACATPSTRPARIAAPRTTSSARSRRRPASSAARTSRKSSTRATAPAASP